jgi:tetratricopeptide (TPR) repeat protein
MNAEEYSKRGDKYFSESNFDGAIADFTEVIKLEQDNPFAYYKRGMSYTSKKEFDPAITDFTEAIRLEPNKFGEFYFDRGGAYVFKEEKALAIADIEMAVKIDPENNGYREALKELKTDKATDSGDIWDINAELKKRRIVLLVFTVIGAIGIAMAFGIDSYQGGMSVWIGSGIAGAILGLFFGFGIVPWLEFVKNEWENIKDRFRSDSDYVEGIGCLARMKSLLFNFFVSLIITLFWSTIKLWFLLCIISPFVGIYQFIKLLIERRRIKRNG